MVIAEPMGPRILVRPDPPPDVIRGIARPDSMPHRPESGTVIAVGRQAQDGFLLEGDRVAFPQYSGYAIRIEGEEIVVLTPDEVLFRLGRDSEMPF